MPIDWHLDLVYARRLVDKSKVGMHMAMDIHASMQSIEMEHLQLVFHPAGGLPSMEISIKASCDSTHVEGHLISL